MNPMAFLKKSKTAIRDKNPYGPDGVAQCRKRRRDPHARIKGCPIMKHDIFGMEEEFHSRGERKKMPQGTTSSHNDRSVKI